MHTYIGVEQIIARHARLTGDTGRNHNDIGTGQSLAEALIGPRRPRALAGKVAGGFGIGGDVAQIRRDAGSSDDIVAGELVNLGTELAKHGKRLADATSGAEDGYLGRGGGGEEKAREAAALAVEVVATFLRAAAAVADRAANILFYWKSFGDEEGYRMYMESYA